MPTSLPATEGRLDFESFKAAVRVLVGDEPITSASDAQFLIDRLTNQIEYYRTKAKYKKPEDREQALGLFHSAIEKLGGQVDP